MYYFYVTLNELKKKKAKQNKNFHMKKNTNKQNIYQEKILQIGYFVITTKKKGKEKQKILCSHTTEGKN